MSGSTCFHSVLPSLAVRPFINFPSPQYTVCAPYLRSPAASWTPWGDTPAVAAASHHCCWIPSFSPFQCYLSAVELFGLLETHADCTASSLGSLQFALRRELGPQVLPVLRNVLSSVFMYLCLRQETNYPKVNKGCWLWNGNQTFSWNIELWIFDFKSCSLQPFPSMWGPCNLKHVTKTVLRIERKRGSNTFISSCSALLALQ